MIRGTLIVAGLATALWTGPSYAQSSVLERLSAMEKRIQYLEKRVADQDTVIAKKEKELTALKGETATSGDKWFNRLEITGGVELEAAYSKPFAGDATTDATVATAAIGVAAQVHDWVSTEISLLYEEDDTPLEVDTASFSIAPPEGNWSFTGGQIYVPFGSFPTHLISDPLTLEIGETRETALQAGFTSGGFGAVAYAFNGTNNDSGDSHIDGFGGQIGYTHEEGDNAYGFGVGFISDIGDSDNIQDAIATNLGNNNIANYVSAWTANVGATFGPVSLIGEYLSALEDFAPGELPFGTGGAQPAAWNIEAAYTFMVAQKETTFAVAYQGTDEALALSLPEHRFLTGLSVGIWKKVSVALEYAHDLDYAVSDGGTGDTAHTVTTQVAVEF